MNARTTSASRSCKIYVRAHKGESYVVQQLVHVEKGVALALALLWLQVTCSTCPAHTVSEVFCADIAVVGKRHINLDQ